MDKQYLPNSTWCFVCGEDNPSGLKTRFYIEDDMVKTPLTAVAHHCGYPNTVHGGVVTAALDECMGWAAARSIKRMCLTAEITVRFLLPVPDNKPLTVCSEVLRAHRLMVQATGRIIDADGVEYVRAEGRFTPLSPEQTVEVDDMLIYRGGEERIFDELREV
jgi:acyl-coenzyme A thioesterase PaaI-like protein